MAVTGKNLARWYRETSQNLSAGFTLPRAWESSGGVPARHRRRLADELRAGESIDDVLKRAPQWLPQVDRYVLSSAAHSGRMVETLSVLATQRAFAARQAARAIGAAIYPFFLVHFAVMLLVVYILITGFGTGYLRWVAPSVVLLWLMVAILFWSVRRRQRWVHWLMRLIPLLRGYSKNRSLADLCFTLRAYLVAGETVDVAWFGAGRVCDDRRLRRLAEKVSEQAGLGLPPGEQIASARILPEEFISLYQTGERSGQLDENLDHLWGIYSERASEKLLNASFWYPKLLLVVVAIGIAYFAVRFYAGYFNTLLEM